MKKRIGAVLSAFVGVSMLYSVGAGACLSQAANAEETKPTQTVNVDYATTTGKFRGGASGTLYGLGDDGSPTDSILSGARVENSSQKPPSGTQHPSGDALALENQFFASGGKQLAVYMQDYYPDWAYHSGQRPNDDRSYVTDVPVSDPRYGTYTNTPNGRWDYEEVTEIVANKILANTEHPDQYMFIPFNEPDGGNWYWTDDDANNELFKTTFLNDWDSEYQLIQHIWNEYKNGAKPAKVKPTSSLALIAGPGDSSFRANRTDAFLTHAKAAGTLPGTFVWHELGKESLARYRSHLSSYRTMERNHGIDPIPVNITEYGELRDMSVPGQLIQWMSMFEDTKVQAETAYWNYAGNISDNMARANSANAGWWQFKWYGDLRGNQTVKTDTGHLNQIDALQAIGALDKTNRKATVLYGGANDSNSDQVQNTGANIPVRVHMTGLDQAGLSGNVDVEVRENAFTGPDGVAATPRVVNAMSNVAAENGTLDVTTPSVDRYASYQLVVTPHQDRELKTDDQNGRQLLVKEAERTTLSGGAQAYDKTPSGSGWSYFMTSGNGDVGNFKDGAAATWSVDVPADGVYRLQVISGNTGYPGKNAVSVDGADAGSIQYGAELAMKSAAKWLYRGSGELTLKLAKGHHDIALHGDSSFDNTLDKLLLYRVGDNDGAQDETDYPSSQFRLEGGAAIDYGQQGSNGFAKLNGGSVDAYVHAWDAGYHDATVTYKAAKGSSLKLVVNGVPVADCAAQYDGLQTTTFHLALSEGINRLSLSSPSAMVRDVKVSRATQSDSHVIRLEAENLQLGGGAQVVNKTDSNASGKSFVTGLGNQFETSESGPAGMGDPTRVVVKDSNNTPSVITGNKGVLTVPAGEVPAGSYNVVVRFSNDAFIGHHDYNPQIVDLGLQVRQGGADGQEVARGAFRYTYSDTSFLNRSMMLASNGSALSFGNWDPSGSSKGAVSWGVAPNIDSLSFYPVSVGSPVNVSLEANHGTQPEPPAGDGSGHHPQQPSSSGVSLTIDGEHVKDHGLDMKVGQTEKLTVRKNGPARDSASPMDVHWSSSDEHVASIDATGTLKALRPGDALISVSLASDPSVASTLRVHVAALESKEPVAGVSGDKVSAGPNEQRPADSLSSTGASVTAVAMLAVAVVALGAAVLLLAIKHRR